MVLTLELPIRHQRNQLFVDYESRFGALPEWLDDLPPPLGRSLLRQALRRGAPLAAADWID